MILKSAAIRHPQLDRRRQWPKTSEILAFLVVFNILQVAFSSLLGQALEESNKQSKSFSSFINNSTDLKLSLLYSTNKDYDVPSSGHRSKGSAWPTQNLVLGSPAGSYVATVKVFHSKDPVSDSVRFHFVEPSYEFAIDDLSGVVITRVTLKDVRSYDLRIQAVDTKGRKSLIETLHVNVIQNREKKRYKSLAQSLPDPIYHEFRISESAEIGTEVGSINLQIMNQIIGSPFQQSIECVNGFYVKYEYESSGKVPKMNLPFLIESSDFSTIFIVLGSPLDYEELSVYDFSIFMDPSQCSVLMSWNQKNKTMSQIKEKESFVLVALVKVTLLDDDSDCDPFDRVYQELRKYNSSMMNLEVAVSEEAYKQVPISIFPFNQVSSKGCKDLSLDYFVHNVDQGSNTVDRTFSVSEGMLQLIASDQQIINDLLSKPELIIAVEACHRIDKESDGPKKVLGSLLMRIRLRKESSIRAEQVSFINPPTLILPEDCCNKGDDVFQIRLKHSCQDCEILLDMYEQNGKSAVFQMDRETGLVSLLSNLDYERDNSYTLNITASFHRRSIVSPSKFTQSGPTFSQSTSSQSLPARSPILEVWQIFTIIIENVNDEKPMFTLPTYSREILENVASGTVLLTVEAHDADPQSELFYLIPAGHPEAKFFAVDSKSGSIRTIATLDRELRPEHRIPVYVFDTNLKHFSVAHVTIHLIDINDNPPVFASTTQRVKIPENILPGKVFHTFIASDKDLLYPRNGSQPSSLLYSVVSGNQAEDFLLNSKSGELSVRPSKRLDRERTSHYELEIQVTDSVHQNFCNLTIELQDLNDNSPVFTKKIYYATIEEKKLVECDSKVNIVQVKAIDSDEQSEIYYSIPTASTSDGIFFNIDPATGHITASCVVLMQIQRKKKLESNPSSSKTTTFTFEVVASDIGSSFYAVNEAKSTVQVTVLQSDTPESPRLAQSPIVIELSKPKEFYKIGSEVARIPIVLESKRNHLNDVNYVFLIEKEDPEFRFSDFFDLDRSIGVLKTKRSLIHDYYEVFIRIERKDSMYYTQALLQIFMTDRSSDHWTSKRVTTFSFKVELYENLPPGTEVINLVTRSKLDQIDTATDYRFSIAYSSVNQSSFYLSSISGVLTLGKSLDYESDPSQTDLIIMARKIHHPFQSPLFFNLTLFLLNVNDNAPKFTQHHYIASVKEGEHRSTFVIQLAALDLDKLPFETPFSGLENRGSRNFKPSSNVSRESYLSYHILEGNHDEAFVIHPPGSGTVMTNIVLDREIRDHYVLKIVVNDEGSVDNGGDAPSYSPATHLLSHCTLEIIVVDINDNIPAFPPYREVSIAESAEIGTPIISLTANDVDVFPPISYSMKSASGSEEMFAIGLYTGKIASKRHFSSFFGDKNTLGEFKLNVTASDSLNMIETQVTIRMKEQSIFSKSPTLEQDSYVFCLNPLDHECVFQELLDCEIGKISADLAKLPKSAKLHVSFKLATKSSYFYIDSSSGIIYSNRTYQHLPRRLHQLVVVAYYAGQNGYPINDKRASTTVLILVPDSSLSKNLTTYAESEERNTYEVHIDGQSVGEIIFTFAGNFSGIRYRIVEGNHGSVFAIKQNKEVVLAKRTIKNEYRLMIEKSLPSETAKIVTISIVVKVVSKDLESLPSAFPSQYFSLEVSEDSPINFPVIDLKLERQASGEFYFYIFSGNELDHFRVDKTTGVIYVNQQLDFEVKNHYQLGVVVRRTSDQWINSFCIISVSLINVDDNKPIFPLAQYKITVDENTPVGSKVFMPKAYDRDQSTLTYSLLRKIDGLAPFVFDQDSGYLIISDVLDYESNYDGHSPPLYKIVVKAFESSSNFAEALIEVQISSVDEYVPIFNSDRYDFKLTTSLGLEQVIVGQVSATDADSGPDGQIFYTLLNASPSSAFDKFVLNASTGVLSFNTARSDKVPPPFTSLIASASTNRTNSLSSMVRIGVTVILPERKHPTNFADNNLVQAGPISEMEITLQPFPSSSSQSSSSQQVTALPGWVLFLLVLLMLITVVLLIIIVVIRFHQHQHQHIHPHLSHHALRGHNICQIVPGVGTLLREIGVNRSAVDSINESATIYDPVSLHGVHCHGASHHGHFMGSPHGAPFYNDAARVNNAVNGETTINAEKYSASSGRGSAEEDEVERELDEVDEEVRMINEASEYCGFDNGGHVGDDRELVFTVRDYLAHIGVRDTLVAGGEEASEPRADQVNLANSQGSFTFNSNDAQKHDKQFHLKQIGEHDDASYIGEELVDAYGWDYLVNWAPKYQSLSAIFTEVSRLKVNVREYSTGDSFGPTGMDSVETASQSSAFIKGSSRSTCHQ